MLNSKWTKSKVLENVVVHFEDSPTPTLDRYTYIANLRAYWFAWQLLQETKLKSRIKLLEQLIKVAMNLNKIKNYQSLMIIFLTLNLRSISRLLLTWKGIKPKALSMWKKISSLMKPKDNFKNYRETIKVVEPPFIPCQEIILKDLLYHDTATPNFVEEGIWNFKKLNVIGKILDDVRHCQEAPFNYKVYTELIEFLSSDNKISVEELDNLSAQIEPSNLSSNNASPHPGALVSSKKPRSPESSTDFDRPETTTESETDSSFSYSGSLTRGTGSLGSFSSDMAIKRYTDPDIKHKKVKKPSDPKFQVLRNKKIFNPPSVENSNEEFPELSSTDSPMSDGGDTEREKNLHT
uniref:Ras-GEF domain-containing protein n=1 Tax=Arcella intermedia TaxID=1963864 RepID=A0A6B2L7F6_9EUKA